MTKCELSSLWISNPSYPFSHFGAANLGGLKSPWAKKNRVRSLAIYLLPFLIGLVLPVRMAVYDLRLDLTLMVLSLAYLVICLGLFFYSAWRSRAQFLNRIFQLDFWMGLFVIVSLIEIFFGPQGFLWPNSPSSLLLLALGCLAWIQIRTFEAWLWRRPLKKSFRNADYFWKFDQQILLKYERYLGALTLVILFGFQRFSRSWSLLIAGTFPLMLPYFQWIITRLMATAEKHDFICQDFSKFRELRKTDLLISHQYGVVTKDEFKVKEIWIEDSEDFTESEIKDVFRQLGQISDHPISKLVSREFASNSRHLMKLEKSEVKKNLGLVAVFEDLKRQRTTATFGGLVWHKILQDHISEEGMKKIRDWKQAKFPTTLLSLNREVVAAVAWTSPLRDEVNTPFLSKVPTVLLSSQNQIIDDQFEKNFVQISTQLLPIERDIQQKYWGERAKHPTEVKAIWDASATSEIVMISQRSELLERPLGVLNGKLNSAHWALMAAPCFERNLKLAFSVGTLASVCALLEGSLMITLMISGALYVSTLALFTLRPIK